MEEETKDHNKDLNTNDTALLVEDIITKVDQETMKRLALSSVAKMIESIRGNLV